MWDCVSSLCSRDTDDEWNEMLLGKDARSSTPVPRRVDSDDSAAAEIEIRMPEAGGTSYRVYGARWHFYCP